MSIEVAILIWLVIGIGITAGVFMIARTAVQMASVAYRVIEKELDSRKATREGGLLGLALIGALAATALIAGFAIFVLFASLLDNSGILGGGQ